MAEPFRYNEWLGHFSFCDQLTLRTQAALLAKMTQQAVLLVFRRRNN